VVLMKVPLGQPTVAAPELTVQPEVKPATVLKKPVTSETKPAEVKPAETKPAETKPAETKPAETKPAETKPAAVPAQELPAPEKKTTGSESQPEPAAAKEGSEARKPVPQATKDGGASK